MRKTLFALAFLASALSIPLTAHADTTYQITFNFPADPPAIPSINTTLDFASTPYLDGFFLGQSGSANYLVGFLELSPTETLVEYAPYFLNFPVPPSGAFTHILAPTLFTGSIGAPTFLTGTFNGEYYTGLFGFPLYPGTITIEPLTNSTVPEPSSFALMATGILGAISTLRHRKSMSKSTSRSRTS